MTIDVSRQFVSHGVTGFVDGCASTGPNSVNDAQTLTYFTRGIIDLSLNRLPNISDLTVCPQDAIGPYDSFLISVAGSVPSGVLGTQTLKAGDRLVNAGIDPTNPANWYGISNTAIPTSSNVEKPPYWGTNPNYTVILNRRSAFFTSIAAAILTLRLFLTLLGTNV